MPAVIRLDAKLDAARVRGGFPQRQYFQNFAADSFKETVSEAGKYGLSLILAHQNLAQLPTDLRASVLTCKLQIYFRLSRPDAELLAKVAYAGIFNGSPQWEEHIQELQTLPKRTCIAKYAEGGMIKIGIPPIRSATEVGWGESEFDALVAEKNIGGRYLRKREDIEKEYQARMHALMGGEKETESFYEK
jgi:hypothetical protein